MSAKYSTHEIVCVHCESSPRLKSLDKNRGTVVACDCVGPSHSLHSLPYANETDHFPDSWHVLEDASPRPTTLEDAYASYGDDPGGVDE